MERGSVDDKSDRGLTGREAPRTAVRREQRQHLVFFALVLALIVVFLTVPILLLDTGFYIRHSNYIYDPVIDFKASLTDNSADILIYGDSSALHNVVPAVIKKEANLNVYNLGYSAPILVGSPYKMLDRYLARNKVPQTIVLYIGPELRVTGRDPDSTHFYEEAMILERYSSLTEAIQFYARSPRRIFEVAAVVLRNLLTPPVLTEQSYRVVTSGLSAQAGWVATPPEHLVKKARLQPGKHQEAKPPLVPDSQFIEDFRKKYTALGMRVLVFLAPISDCSGRSVDEVRAAYRTLADNEPYSLPCDSFVDGIHIDERAAEDNSLRVAQALRTDLEQPSASR